MKSKKRFVIILIILVILIVLVPIFINQNSDFKGTDDLGKQMITEIKPGYKPWAKSLILLPSSETETLLFCVQAALGAGIFGFALGVLIERNRNRKCNKEQNQKEDNRKV